MQENITYTDAELVSMLNNNDEAAFTQLYNRYWEKLFYVASIKLDDCYLAQEVVQDLFLDIWNRRHTLQITAGFATYIAAALKYKIINARLKRSREKDKLSVLKDGYQKQHYSLEQQLSFEELQQRLEKLVASLPEKCQLIYKLSRDGGYHHKEIAKKLRISEKTVEAYLTRALKALRNGLNFILTLYCKKAPIQKLKLLLYKKFPQVAA